MSTTDATTAAGREDRVLERIDKFRQRRPRLLDDVVTLAHGAGGKSSAALVDAVFLEAFRNDELEQLGDAAIALSTSGNSEDLMTAITEAKQRGLLTIGFAGHDGGRMAVADDLDYCFTVHSQSIHRIQESHAMLGYRLWSITQDHLAHVRPAS